MDLGEFLTLSPDMSVYVIDSHRPLNLHNLFNHQQICVLDDGDVADLNEERMAFEQVELYSDSDEDNESSNEDSDLDDPLDNGDDEDNGDENVERYDVDDVDKDVDDVDKELTSDKDELDDEDENELENDAAVGNTLKRPRSPSEGVIFILWISLKSCRYLHRTSKCQGGRGVNFEQRKNIARK